MKTLLCKLHGIRLGKNVRICGGTKFTVLRISMVTIVLLESVVDFMLLAAPKIELANDVAVTQRCSPYRLTLYWT